MKPLKATISTSKPVMSNQDFDTLFYRVPEIREMHALFYSTLKPRLDTWSADTTVGDLFKQLVSLNMEGSSDWCVELRSWFCVFNAQQGHLP